MARPRRPYLLRALYEWIVDSGLTPHILVAVDSDAVQVPADYVSDGQIVLNVSAAAVRDLDLGDERVSVSGRFGGRPFPVVVPMASVLAVYARESGEGMMFPPEYGEPAGSDEQAGAGGDAGSRPDGAPVLKVIK